MHHQPRRARCLRGTCTAVGSRFASEPVLRAAHLFALGDGVLLLVIDVVTPMLTGYTLDELLWVIVVVDEVVEEDCK